MTDKLHFYDLTKITCPPGMLDDDTFDRLRVHKGDVEWWEGGSWVASGCYLMRTARYVYRAAPAPVTPIDVPWHMLADWAQWAAKDESGEVWAYECKPKLHAAHWESLPGEEYSLHAIKIDAGTCGWRDSLIQRPEGA